MSFDLKEIRKSNMNNAGTVVVRGSSFRVIGLAANVMVGFFLMPFLVHSLGDRLYGYWVLIGAILGYYGLLDLGIVSAVQYQVAKALGDKDSTSANRAISTSFYTFGALGLLVLISTVVISLLSHRLISNPSDANLFRSVFLIMGIGFAVGFPGRAFIGAISAHLRWDLISAIGLVVLLLRAASIVLSIKLGYGIVVLAVVSVASDVVMYLLYYLTLARIQAEFRLSVALATLPTLREILRYSVYTFATKISDQLRFYVDALVVSVFVGVAAVTHYAIASRLALSFLDLLIALLGMLSPWFSLLLGSRDFVGIRRVLAFGTKVSVSVSTLIGCCLILYGKGLISAWMGVGYLDAYWPLVILVGGLFFDVSQQPSISYMFGVSRHKFLAGVTFIEGIANAGLSVYLARKYGLIGVAIGTAVPMLVLKLFIQPIYVCRQSGLTTKTYYVGLFGRAAAVTASAVIIPWLLLFRTIRQPNLLAIAVLVACQMILATVAAYLFVFDKGEKRDIIRIFFGRGKTSRGGSEAGILVGPEAPMLASTQAISGGK
jgi:O-antigen/teichoic acid export membrane protein